MLRSNISAREREKAERATLVQQDKLIKAKVSRGLLSCQVGAAMPGKLTCLGCRACRSRHGVCYESCLQHWHKFLPHMSSALQGCAAA